MAYEIANYDELYRPYDKSGRDLKFADWVKVPAKPKGDGLQALLEHNRGLEVFGVWILLLQKATKQKPENRGKLLNHKDLPASVEEIAKGISLSKKVRLVEYSLSVLVSMGWVNGDIKGHRVPKSCTKSRVEKSSVEKDMSIFDEARLLFHELGGTVRGLDVEFGYFCRTHKNWREVVPLLVSSIERLGAWRKNTAAKKQFVPHMKNFKTWIYQSCWSEMQPVALSVEQKREAKMICVACKETAHITVGTTPFCGSKCRLKVLGW